MFAQLVRLTKQFRDAFDHWLDLIPAHERIQADREMRFGREPASDAQREAGFIYSIEAARNRGQTNIIDLGISAPRAAAGNRNLEFARQIIKVRVASKHLGSG